METAVPAVGYGELREQLLPWAVLPVGLAGLAFALGKSPEAPLVAAGIEIALFVLAGAVCLLSYWRRDIAAWVLSLGVFAVVTFAVLALPQVGLRHLLILPVVMAGITLGWGGCLAMTALSTVLLTVIIHGETLAGPEGMVLALDVGALWCTAFYLGIAERPKETIIAWAWRGYEEARRNLEQARDRQVALKQALEDLALAHRQTARLNDLLLAARQQVESARRAKEEFVANVSHELRTPLNMIIGFSDMILEAPHSYSPRLPSDLLADVAAIKRNSRHLSSLVDDVLCLAEMDTGPVPLVRENVCLRTLVGEASATVSVLLEQKGLWLHLDVPDDLPEVACDRTRIRQVILNLLSNASRFTEAGGVTISAKADRTRVHIAVADTGPGISSRNIPRLFEPFQQEDPSIRRRYGGTGLGLAISKRFVELHGGKIWLESEEGQGTTAHFCLPVGDCQPQEGHVDRWFSPYQSYEARTRPSSAPAEPVPPCVVVVEKGDLLTRLMRRHLPDLEVITFPSVEVAGEEAELRGAVAIVINGPPDATDGRATDLGSRPVDVPIISCWVPDMGIANQGTSSQGYLVKPIRRDELLGRLALVAPDARSVLVVDDDREALHLFSRILASSGREYDVMNAEDGEEALTIMQQRAPDVMLLDLVMPNKDGFAVLEAMAREPALQAIPTIIISARDPQQQPIMSRTLSITRPQGLSARELIVLIQAALQGLQPRFGPTPHRETYVA